MSETDKRNVVLSDFSEDEELAIAYLCGTATGYLKPNSAEERSGRKAVARLLRRNETSYLVRGAIADLIDPNPGPREHRQFVVTARGRGVPPKNVRDQTIALFIHFEHEKKVPMKRAIGEAAKKYGVSERQARRVWEKRRHVLKKVFDEVRSKFLHGADVVDRVSLQYSRAASTAK